MLPINAAGWTCKSGHPHSNMDHARSCDQRNKREKEAARRGMKVSPVRPAEQERERPIRSGQEEREG